MPSNLEAGFVGEGSPRWATSCRQKTVPTFPPSCPGEPLSHGANGAKTHNFRAPYIKHPPSFQVKGTFFTPTGRYVAPRVDDPLDVTPAQPIKSVSPSSDDRDFGTGEGGAAVRYAKLTNQGTLVRVFWD